MERHGNTGFDGIAEMLLQQKKLMEALEAENRELRRQLADLRRGVGITVVIEGKTIQLATDPNLQSLQASPAPATAAYTPAQRPVSQPAPGGASSADRRENGAARNPLADSFVL
jgi:hypothetical protein